MTEPIGGGGESGGRSREVAVSLMRMALPLLDRSGEAAAAARLQAALELLEPDARAVRPLELRR